MFILESVESNTFKLQFKQMTGWNFEHGYWKKGITIQQNEDD